MRLKSSYALLVLTTVLTSCRFGPDHCVPVLDIPEDWISPQLLESTLPVDPDHSLVCWWEHFNDPLLNSFMEKIFTDNLDVQIAAERILQAYKQRNVSTSRLYPQINNEIQYNNSKPGSYSAIAALTEAGASGFSSLNPNTILQIDQKTDLIQFNATWEVDLFGGIRRQIESDSAFIGVQIEVKNGILISALSEFARNYFLVRANQRLSAIVENQINTLKDQLNLTENRYNAGIDTEEMLQTQQQNVKNLEISLPPIKTSLYAEIFRLSVLLGQNPEALLECLEISATDLVIPDTLPEILPSELLKRRPDIRQAERTLAQNTADLGVAYADFFPKVNLIAYDGFERIRIMETLLKGNIWSYEIDLLTPILNGGRIRENILLHESLRREAFINYQRVVLLAFEETENALIGFLNATKIYKDTSLSYDFSKKVYDHAENQYNAGAISEVDFKIAKNALLLAEQPLVNAKVQAGISLIYLYKALGGGW